MEELRAEMMASVWKVLVIEGDVVTPDQPLIILESMKMEVPVVTEEGGRVMSVSVAAGEVVQEGDLLVSVEP